MTLTQVKRGGITANAKDRVCVLDYIPVAQHAAIRAGTSTYDCTSAIQSALTDSAPNPDEARAVFFPAGKYSCNSGLTLLTGAKLIGEALEKSEHFVHKGTGTVIQFASGGITAVQQNKIEFYNITIRSESTYSDQYLVKFNAVYACRFHNVVISYQGTHASATSLYMDADDGNSNTADYAWSNFFDNCVFSSPRMANSAGGHTIEFHGSDSWFNNIYSSGGKGILTKPGGNNWSNIHCEHSHSGSALSASGTNAGFTVKVDSYINNTEKIINVSNLYCDLNDIAIKWDITGTGTLHTQFNFSNILCRSNARHDFLFASSGTSTPKTYGGSIVNYHSMGSPSAPINTSGTVTKPFIQTEGTSLTDIAIGINTLSPNSNLNLDIGGATDTGLLSLQNPALYAGLPNNTNWGGVVLGAGENGNTPFVAASQLSNGNDLPLHLITGGTKRLSVTNDSSNNTLVGISDTSPECTLDVGGASTGGLNGLSRPVLYAGYGQANGNNFGGIVLGTGPTANTPYVAAAKAFDGTAQSLSFYTGGTKRLSILGDQAGVCFGSDNAAANCLDDYEEGTFTPTIIGTTSAGTASYSGQRGKYTKIGNTVLWRLYVSWTNGNGSGDLRVDGLPFNEDGNNSVYAAVTIGYVHNVTLSSGYILTALTLSGDNQIYFYQYPNGGGSNTGLTYDASGSLILSGQYNVA